MEEPADGTTVADVDQDSRSAAVLRHRGSRTYDVGRRNSLVDLRRRDTAINHSAVAQFKGLVIPSPAATGSGDGARSSLCLPTIAGTKPQSNFLLRSSTLERGGSSGYQSVLTGPPFISTSRPSAANVHRRSSVFGYPSLQQSSASSLWRSSMVEPSGTSERVDNVSDGREGDADAIEPGLPYSVDELRKSKSRQSAASVDASGATGEVETLPDRAPLHSRDEGSVDDRLLSRDGLYNNASSPSSEFPVSRTSRERDVSRGTSITESLKADSLKTDKQHEERPDCEVNAADVQQAMSSCRLDTVDIERGRDFTGDASAGSERIESECQPGSTDLSVVSPIMALQIQSKSANNGPERSSADCREMEANTRRDSAAETVMDVDGDDWDSHDSVSSGQERSQVDSKFNEDADDTGTDSVPRPDLTSVIICKGNLGLGFCISGGRALTGDNPIVVKRVFKGNFIIISSSRNAHAGTTSTAELTL